MKCVFKTLGFLRIALYANLDIVPFITPTINKERVFQGEIIYMLQ